MKAIVLAGGFAKRMWPLTKDRPKQLLPVAGKPMLDYILDKLELVSGLEEIYISTNARFEDQFKEYLENLKTTKKVFLFIEDTHSEGEKLGSVGALGFLLREKKIDDELLVIGGDNLFEFEMQELTDCFYAKKTNVLALYDIGSRDQAKLYGVVETNSDNKIIGFQEKPEAPKSNLVSTACYIFTKAGMRNILKYLDEGNDPDKIGHFIEWLYQHDDVYAFVFSGRWFDIGSFESYDEANQYFAKK